MIVKRPWGHWEVLKEEPGRKVKLLTVMPGQSLSKQRHFKRSEQWLCLEGEGILKMYGDTKFALEPGETAFIDIEQWHQLVNNGDEDLVILEVQEGEECVEEDIERQAEQQDEFTFEKRC
jgi:mannose-6-phosphate isomerase-like protein (cupin superfamily)